MSARWQPLEYIIYGFAIQPLNAQAYSRLSTVPNNSPWDSFTPQVTSSIADIEVGDEVYAFEHNGEQNNIWYRGYVVSTSKSPTVQGQLHDPMSLNGTGSAAGGGGMTAEEPQVSIAIFPASYVHIRDELPDAEGRLTEIYHSLQQNGVNGHMRSLLDRYGMEPLREEDEFRAQAVDNPHSPRSPRSATTPTTTMFLSAPFQSMNNIGDNRRTPSPFPEKPMPPRPSLKSGDDTASGQVQPLVDEIASALREWHSLLHTYLTRRDYKLFNAVRQHLEALHLGRRQLLSETLSADETAALRKDCVVRLVRGNIAQGLDVIVRHPVWGSLVTVDVEGDIDTRSWLSAVRMYAMQVSLAYMDDLQNDYGLIPRACALHSATDPSSLDVPDPTQSPIIGTGGPMANRRAASIRRPSHQMSIVSSPRATYVSGSQPTSNSGVKFFHVYFELRAFVASPCSPGETAEVYFSLYNKSAGQFLTEEFCAVLNHNGVLARDNMSKVRTLFRDLGSQDVQDSIYLVCRIVRNGSMKLGLTPASAGYAKNAQDVKSAYLDEFGLVDGAGMVRRPFGCAVSELTQLARVSAGGLDVGKEHTLPIFVPVNEAAYSTLHQDLIASRTKEFEKSPRAEMLAVTIRVFHGEASTIIKENPSLLQDVPNTYRLGFPDVVFPGDVRNEVYIKLWSGEFNSSSGSAGNAIRLRKSVGGGPSNIQVTVEVRTPSGHTVENAICLGTGEPPLTYFNSMVFYHNNIPTWGELIKLKIPASIMPECHLFFTFRHRSSKEKGTSISLQGSHTSPTGDGGANSERPFAFAYLPLFPDKQAFLEDGSHTLVLYKAEKMATINVKDYFNAPFVVKAKQRPESLPIPASLSKTAVPSRDSFTIRSFLCSTMFTSNSVLLGLLHWEKLNDKEEILTALSQFTFVGEMEIVKFLRDIFDSLFAILVSSVNQNNEMDDLVFNALVIVLGIVQDRRFNNFQPVLDVYIEKHFTCAAAHNRMIRSMNRLLSNAAGQDTASKLRATLKVWHYVFKFIVRARELQKAKEASLGTLAAEHLEGQFKKEVWGHLGEVNKLMSTLSPSSIIGTQTIALQHFTTILPELSEVFTKVELVSVVTAFANAANSLGNRVGKIGIWKLMMYLQLVQGFLFDDQESRGLLLESVVGWIKPCFGRYDEYLHIAQEDGEVVRDNSRVSWLEAIRLCVTIVAVMLDKLNKCLVDPIIAGDRRAFRQEQDNVEFLLSLLPRLLDSYRELKSPAMFNALARHRSPATTASTIPVIFPGSYPFSIVPSTANNARRSLSGPLPSHQSFYQQHATEKPLSFNPGLADTAITLLVLILSAPRKHLVGFFESFLDIEGKDNLGRLLMNYFHVASSVLSNEAFPPSWLNVNILAHKVVMKMSEPIAFVMLRDFVPQEVTNEETESGLARMEELDVNLWKESFLLLLKLLSSDQLVIEEFSPQKRRAVWRLANDIRGEGAAILLRLWEALGWPEAMSAQAGAVTRYGRYQVSLISLVEQVLNICLSHHDQLRSNAVQILYSMIVSEYHHSGNFNEIQTELVSKLDKLFMSETRGDDISRAFFISQLRRLFESSTLDETLKNSVGDFLDSVDQFLGLLLSVRELPEGEEYQDDRVIATLRLMNFIRQIGRDEIYIKYVHQLVNVSNSLGQDSTENPRSDHVTSTDASPEPELCRSCINAEIAL
ncbi:hypothetical protein FRC03_001343 [Tulasnella sp. 419]|nr:hypothetical protein FRC03_001343 [Tulasnella sp. 419]